MVFKRIISTLTVVALLSLPAAMVSCGVSALNNGYGADTGDGISDQMEKEGTGILFPEKGSSGALGIFEFITDEFAHTLSELYDASDAVVLGTVVKDDEQYKNEGSELENALSELEIERVWKGDIKDGETVSIHETGWRYDDGKSASVGGEPVLRKGMKVVLFLGPSREGERWIKNSFQGKFIVDGQGVVHSYEYFSDDNEFSYLDDVGETVPLTDLAATLDGLAEK